MTRSLPLIADAILLSVALFFLPPTVLAAPSFTGTGVFDPTRPVPGPSPRSLAFGVSADGSTVVGFSDRISGESAPFRWTREGGIELLLESPPAGNSRAWSISGDGSFVVGLQLPRWSTGNGVEQIWSGETANITSRDVSDDGRVVVGAGGGTVGVPPQAFYWNEASGSQGLGDLAGGEFRSAAWGVSGDGRVVVGESASGSGTEAFRWTATGGMSGLGDLGGGGFESHANGASLDGGVIVGRGTSALGAEAFRWSESEGMVGLGWLGNPDESEANAVSADGTIIVGRSRGATGGGAFVWDEENGMRDLALVLAAAGIDLSGWTLSEATAVSADGRTIVGYGLNGGRTEGWVAVIPEPGIAVLLGAGLFWLGRRREGLSVRRGASVIDPGRA